MPQVFSNVPGPQQAMYFANEQMIAIQVLYPNLLPQVIALSYNGGIHMNIVVDPDMLRGADEIPGYFVDELVALARAYNLSLTAAVRPRRAFENCCKDADDYGLAVVVDDRKQDMLLTDADIVRQEAVGRGTHLVCA